MNWKEIVIEVEQKYAESLSDAFFDLGVLSVSVEDADEGTDAEKPLFCEPGEEPVEIAWERSRLVVLVDFSQNEGELVNLAAKACNLAQIPEYSVRTVADQDWVRKTQSQFDPIHIGKNIWVVPSWHEAPDSDGIILELDPGLAFGTGSHPTTRLCMEWLETFSPKGKSVLDYGCGSGILAMTAYKLGAERVIGVDIDQQAIIASKQNAVRNNCKIEYYSPDEFGSLNYRKFDIVVANILSNPLKLMAPLLSGLVAKSGSLALSGILARQSEEIIETYAPYIPLKVWREFDGWVLLCSENNR